MVVGVYIHILQKLISTGVFKFKTDKYWANVNNNVIVQIMLYGVATGFLRDAFKGWKADIWCYIALAGILELTVWQVLWLKKENNSKEYKI